ncbi:glycosyltransferase family 1 protein [Luteipulveratus sp. YIM 133132]|uniref:glycosyltransferase family 4 protein n=1 Tax=Luteipulveratus flavus TaxID=3031728 RepID=UPI0023B05A4C|nr:glycosyltransferase family 1 protein [Luteipulveratus sp. YIM 133132]MDE9364299.1 glycosyltransferase family 1 protein [Luteipulveratus sp. YIM 133132]
MPDRHRLVLHTLAASHPMGLQVYDDQVAAGLPAELGDPWEVRRRVGRTLRSPLAGDVRVPGAVLSGDRPWLRAAYGRATAPRADLVHRMDLGCPPTGGPEVLTLHDVVAWRFPDEGMPPRSVHREVRAAAAVICPSQHTAEDVARLFGIEPVVIPNGVGQEFFSAAPLDPDERAVLGVQGPFVLHAQGATLRKNLHGLAAAWSVVAAKRPDVRLVMTGPPHSRRTGLFGDQPSVRMLGRVEEGLVPRLMASAEAVVVPSLYEGFGFPALEAMAAGTPVVAASRSSLPEVCADAAVLCEPDGRSLAEALLAVLDDRPVELVRRGARRAAEYTWARSVRAHARLYTSLVGSA